MAFFIIKLLLELRKRYFCFAAVNLNPRIKNYHTFSEKKLESFTFILSSRDFYHQLLHSYKKMIFLHLPRILFLAFIYLEPSRTLKIVEKRFPYLSKKFSSSNSFLVDSFVFG